jgi:hypothetical protein
MHLNLSDVADLADPRGKTFSEDSTLLSFIDDRFAFATARLASIWDFKVILCNFV